MGLCQKCKKAQATFHLTNIDKGGSPSEHHLCEKCAVEEGYLQIHKQPTTLNEILESFVGSSQSAAGQLASLVCDECGVTYVEFRNQGLLGCPNDYDVFKEPLTKLLERAHDGATQHTGKSPRSIATPRPPQQDLRLLRRQLEEAVLAEDYERAAKLRDRIRQLESP
jgi:protein arginine kinase activator